MKRLYKQLINTIKENTRVVFMYIYQKIHGIDNNKIVFVSFSGKQYSDSGRRLGEELHKMKNDLKIVWLLDDEARRDKYGIIPEYIIKSNFNTMNILKEIATSKIYISNCAFSKLYKNKKQMFIDTWHGDRGFKKVLYEGHEEKKRIWKIYDNKIVDYCIAGSEYGYEQYRKAFKYNGNIISEGMPRNDFLISENNNTNRIKEKLGIKNEKILLYAPTFRDNNSNIQDIKIDFNKVLDELSKDGKEWKLITRSHPASKGVKTIIEDNRVIDLTDYPDMSDILQITDFLITDYSSSAQDFALTKKPIILLIYDYDEYKEKCREFSVDPKEVGFIYAETQEDLIKLIKNTKTEEYEKASNKVNNYYKTRETGKSTSYICDIMINFIDKE